MKNIIKCVLYGWMFVWITVPFVQAKETKSTVNFGSPSVNLDDKSSLRKGAKDFLSYCSGCHSLEHVRYSRVAQDLTIPKDVMKKYVTLDSAKLTENMHAAMRPSDAQTFFAGASAPDLSLISRIRGAQWLYDYLHSFYLDPSRPHGVNNLVFKDTAMPHVLWRLQGWQAPVYEEQNNKHTTIIDLKQISSGAIASEAYSNRISNLVGFLVYVGEPSATLRQRIGIWILIFLGVLFLILFFLKKDYWNDVSK